jgi:hypothetical protein
VHTIVSFDFAVSVPPETPRAARRKQADAVRQSLHGLPGALRMAEPLRGSNESMQYSGTVRYDSLLGGEEQSIRIELSLREPLLLPPIKSEARTILLDPISGGPLVPPVTVRCVALMEAVAEKFRAALSRREAAIRDFCDLDYVVRKLGVELSTPDLVAMVKQKLNVPGNEPADVSGQRLMGLRSQLDARLKPVLRPVDFAVFDLDRAITLVSQMARAVSS